MDRFQISYPTRGYTKVGSFKSGYSNGRLEDIQEVLTMFCWLVNLQELKLGKKKTMSTVICGVSFYFNVYVCMCMCVYVLCVYVHAYVCM